jgi:putative endonuclease
MPTQLTGRLAERQARNYLEQQGLIWVDSNYRCPQGEVDIIMRDRNTLVFVEVRYRAAPDYGSPVETVITQKQRRLIKAAWHYLLENNFVEKINCRFDIVGLSPDQEICWLQNAFEVKY